MKKVKNNRTKKSLVDKKKKMDRKMRKSKTREEKRQDRKPGCPQA